MQYILAAIVAIYCVGLATANDLPRARNETNVCTGVAPGLQIPDVNDCSRFFFCQLNVAPVHGHCGGSSRFNPATSTCVTTPVDCFQCPDDSFIDLPIDNQCIQFVRCAGGRAQQRTCAHGLLFDKDARQCNWASEVSCGCPKVDDPTRPLFVRDPNHCDRYHVCVAGQAVHTTCPKGLFFNIANQQCDHPENVNCSGPNTTGI